MTLLTDYEFRLATADEMKDYAHIVRYVFADNDLPNEEKKVDEDIKPEWTWCAFQDNKMAATSSGYPFKMRLNGFGIQVDGVTDVGTLPQHRRKGIVRKLVEDRLRHSYESEQYASILWASMGAIYQRFGYGLASTQMECRFDPRYSQFEFDEPDDGITRMIDREVGLPIVRSIHRQYIENSTLMLHRADEMWNRRWPKKRVIHCAVHYNAADEPDGYILYGTKDWKSRPQDEIGPDQEMNIYDRAWLNMNAYRSLWQFICSHDLVGRVEFLAALDDPAWLTLLEPRVLLPKLYDGLWLRIVDLGKLLEHRTYATEGECVFTLVEDIECPWNIGTYHLQTDGANTTVTKSTKKGGDFTITPNGMASLLSGQSPLSLLARVGRAQVHNEKKVVHVNTMFTTMSMPFCVDHF